MQSNIRKKAHQLKEFKCILLIVFGLIKSLRLYIFIWGAEKRCTLHKGGLTTKMFKNHCCRKYYFREQHVSNQKLTHKKHAFQSVIKI